MTTLPTLGKIIVPLRGITFTSDAPDPGTVSPVSPQYPKCPMCGADVFATQRTLSPDSFPHEPVVLLYDECGNVECGWRKAI